MLSFIGSLQSIVDSKIVPDDSIVASDKKIEKR